MNRREFLKQVSGAGAAAIGGPSLFAYEPGTGETPNRAEANELKADLVIIGGGLGGCAAALGALRNGLTVILTEPTDWIGGQLTQQGVPPDEHRWIERFGATKSYRRLREAIRDYYRRHYPLSDAARKQEHLDPGNGAVSRLCVEPRIPLAVLESWLAPYMSGHQLIRLLEHELIDASVDGDRVKAVKAKSLRSNREVILTAEHFVDATELGDLLALTGTEAVTGAESREQTGELHALEEADPLNQQAFTYCFAMDFVPGSANLIEKPKDYAFWRDFVPELSPPWPGKLFSLTYTHPSTLEPRKLGFAPADNNPAHALDLFEYRRIADADNFTSGTYQGDMTSVNWPQNDYILGPLTGVERSEREKHIERAKQLSLSLFYWLQTEAPRADRDGQGFPELRLRPDVMGTEDGLAKFPYIREARRIQAVFTIFEEHVGRKNRAMVTGRKESEVQAKDFFDTVGIGSYHLDLHPSSGGNNYIDFPSLPFQIPLGALLPKRMTNLLPAAKNIGTTHITNGCYRLHPVEWNIGESVGSLVAFCQKHRLAPHTVREKQDRLADFQNWIRDQGIPTHWPDKI